MDKFFDRLGDLLQSLLGGKSARSGTYDLRDPDMREAIEELDAYLESGGPGAGGFASEQSRDRSYDWRPGGQQERWKPGSVDQALRKDYATREVVFAAPFADVQKSYKRLLHKYHPDRFSGDEEKQALANEVTQLLNDAFARIERQHKSRGG
jgi:DnaJ-domain-containing protein 1